MSRLHYALTVPFRVLATATVLLKAAAQYLDVAAAYLLGLAEGGPTRAALRAIESLRG